MKEGPISLNKVRKERAKQDARRKADENSIKFGRSKAERLIDATRNEKARAMLDRHQLDDAE